MALRQKKTIKKKTRNDRAKSIHIVPTKLNEDQIQIIKKLQEEADKDGRYIDSVFFN